MGGRPQQRYTETLRRWLGRVPAPVRQRLRRAAERMPAPIARRFGTAAPDRVGAVTFGSLRRTRPFSRTWGYDRGTPIDRVYIEQFLASRVSDVQGACLEVLNADYTRRFGGARVTSSDVLDIDARNGAATVVADLNEPDSLPPARFDCIIFTQTLHLVPDMRVALANIWRALAPGGVLLLTVPAVGRHYARKDFHHDRWRVTKTGLEWLMEPLPDLEADVTTYGNVFTCAAFMYGLAAEELQPDELQDVDKEFPLIVAARAAKGLSA